MSVTECIYTVYQYLGYMLSVIYNYDILSRENYTINGNRKMCIPIHKQLDKNTCSLLYISPIIFNILT